MWEAGVGHSRWKNRLLHLVAQRPGTGGRECVVRKPDGPHRIAEEKHKKRLAHHRFHTRLDVAVCSRVHTGVCVGVRLPSPVHRYLSSHHFGSQHVTPRHAVYHATPRHNTEAFLPDRWRETKQKMCSCGSVDVSPTMHERRT